MQSARLANGPGRRTDWVTVDWRRAHRIVRNLRSRIFRATREGDIKTAREIATRAKMRFPVGSPGWVKADDLASLKPPQSALRRQ